MASFFLTLTGLKGGQQPSRGGTMHELWRPGGQHSRFHKGTGIAPRGGPRKGRASAPGLLGSIESSFQASQRGSLPPEGDRRTNLGRQRFRSYGYK